MTSLIFLRHAQSLLNVAPTIAEHHNVLSPTGVIQAMEAGEKLKDAGICHIISSPVKRAQQTAWIVSGHLGGLPVETHDGLAELGSKNPHIVERWLEPHEMKAFEEDISVVPAWGTESQLDVWHRAQNFMSHNMSAMMERGPTLIVSHTFVLRAIYAYLEHGVPDQMRSYRPKNAEPVFWSPIAGFSTSEQIEPPATNPLRQAQ